jgi:hypothetical protein
MCWMDLKPRQRFRSAPGIRRTNPPHLGLSQWEAPPPSAESRETRRTTLNHVSTCSHERKNPLHRRRLLWRRPAFSTQCAEWRRRRHGCQCRRGAWSRHVGCQSGVGQSERLDRDVGCGAIRSQPGGHGHAIDSSRRDRASRGAAARRRLEPWLRGDASQPVGGNWHCIAVWFLPAEHRDSRQCRTITTTGESPDHLFPRNAPDRATTADGNRTSARSRHIARSE